MTLGAIAPQEETAALIAPALELFSPNALRVLPLSRSTARPPGSQDRFGTLLRRWSRLGLAEAGARRPPVAGSLRLLESLHVMREP